MRAIIVFDADCPPDVDADQSPTEIVRNRHTHTHTHTHTHMGGSWSLGALRLGSGCGTLVKYMQY